MKVKPLIYQQAIRLKRLSEGRVHHPNVFHASEAGDCTREIYFRKLRRPSERGYKSKVDEARIEMLLNDGRAHQAAVTSYLQQAPGIHITDIERDGLLVESPILITGHPDAVMHDVKTKERAVLEVKGLSTWIPKYSRVQWEDYNIDTLKANYPSAIPQARVYMKMFNASSANIVIKIKDNSELFEFIIEHDEIIYKRIVDKFLSVYKSITNGEDKGVFCDFAKDSNRTKFCNYPGECGYGR